MDVRADKQKPEQRASEKELFQLMVENVHDYACLLLDSEGQVVSWNVGAERILGYKETEIVGRHFSISAL